MAQTPLVPDKVVFCALWRDPGFERLGVDSADFVGGVERGEGGGGENVGGEFWDGFDYVGCGAEGGEEVEGYAADAARGGGLDMFDVW